MNLFFWRKKKKPKRKYLRYILVLCLAYLLIVLWPVRNFLMPSFLFGKHLVLFTNEAEARPCGGFLTAFGTASLFPPKFELKNSYHFEKASFGLAMFPLSRVAERKQFWDLGDDPNLALCSKSFQYAYEQATEENIDQVILVDLKTIESLLMLTGNIDIDGKKIAPDHFFSTLSRTVANIDRHDETALLERKTPLATTGKSVIKKMIIRPWIWAKATATIGASLKNGNIYNEDISPEIAPRESDFSIIEWNLGGGKSSRFLQKEVHITAYERSPENWKIKLDFQALHLGGEDEPVSQYWKGVFQIKTPEFLGEKDVFLETSIVPGEKFTKTMEWNFSGPLEDERLSFFRPRGQNIFVTFAVAHFPQKYIKKANFPFHEGIGTWRSDLETFRKNFVWSTAKDEITPFITLHEIIHDLPSALLKYFPENPNKKYFYAEIHLNESVMLGENFSALAIDRDFAEKRVTDHPIVTAKRLLDDNKTLILQLSQETPQVDERFYLQISGINDFWGNPIKTQKRTLITR